ncbi:carbon-nitrogen hydrolase family protein [Brumicola pallidula]|jgi:predicted amidohydrolase|uniref:Amidase n=1 Tax=Brumicola pallidula DSM 14239 = ACAM 615 TaxID=1121922 RepID=K6ZIE4_9ALTE|nr:carbon-nitrogen hydrolase family protein [Glaciecola pallidula]GAC28663.1 amidase [Glaciecola pallidula DSM 14239 = ACAM 615]
MSHFSIAGLQLALHAGDNLDVLANEIIKTKLRFPWVDMIVLSELGTYGPEKKYASELPNKTENVYCQLAKEQDVWLIPGSFYEQAGSEVFNTTTVINNKGEVVKRYRKIYPFFPYEEGVSCGQDFVVFDVPQGRIGVAICYDLWFPEVARQLTSMGAEVLIYPTLTGTIDRPIELIMAQATAATNQSYVIAINAAGELGNGQSIAVGPQGNIIYQAGVGVEIIPIEVDFELTRRNRERGLHCLGQPLKSFANNQIQFSVYADKAPLKTILKELGPLAIPKINTIKRN